VIEEDQPESDATEQVKPEVTFGWYRAMDGFSFVRSFGHNPGARFQNKPDGRYLRHIDRCTARNPQIESP